MEPNDAKNGPGSEDSGTYELDLNEDTESEVDDLMRDALAAVEAVEEKHLKKKISREDSSLDSDITAETEGSAAGTAEALEPEIILEDDAPDEDQGKVDTENEELRNRLMRTLADFDNYRKRSEKEKEAQKRYAVTDTLKDFLPVADNLERALASAGSVDELKQGVDMILRQLGETMKRWGVVPVKAVGEPFDPSVHEAVAREDSSEIHVPTVTGELQRGYMIHDRLLRPAMVSVAMPAAKPKPEADTEENSDEEA